MVVVVGRKFTNRGELGEALPVKNGFHNRDDAVRYLRDLIDKHRPNSGRDTQRETWWVRRAGVRTKYTIETE